MPWFRVDDKFHGHPKAVDASASLAALGLWVLTGSYCSDYPETGGFVSLAVAARFAGGAQSAKKLGAVLVDAKGTSQVGLWTIEPGGWQFHNWGHYQPTAEEVTDRIATVSAKRSEAGRKGAFARWQLPSDVDGKPDGKPMAIAILENGKPMAPIPIPIPIPEDPPPPSGAPPQGIGDGNDDESSKWDLPSSALEAEKKPRRKPETDCPSSTEDPAVWFAQWGIPSPQQDPEVQRFLDHHRSKGNRMRDWTAAWRKWSAGAFVPSSATRLRVVQPVPATGRIWKVGGDE